MPEQFEALRLELRKRGVAPLYVERTVAELSAHLADLESAARAAGLSDAEAEHVARATLGDDRTIAAARQSLTDEISPIDDIRSTKDYRLQVSLNLLEDFLVRLR